MDVAWEVRKGFLDKVVLRGILRDKSGWRPEWPGTVSQEAFWARCSELWGHHWRLQEGSVVRFPFSEVFSVWVWSRDSCSAIPRRAAAASPTFFLTGHIHGPHSDLLNQIFEGAPGPGCEQALLVISMHVTAWEPLSWRMDDRRDLENVYYKSLCLTNDWPEGSGWISNLSKIKLEVVIIKTQVSWLCQEFCHANFLGSLDFHSIFKRKE